jgi:hypothetical protein
VASIVGPDLAGTAGGSAAGTAGRRSGPGRPRVRTWPRPRELDLGSTTSFYE